MERLIDADEAYKVLTDYYNHRTEIQHKALKEAIGRVPIVDAEPVKHGEWRPEITELGTMVFRCSVCRRLIDIHWAYCPRCGAKMDGERKVDGTASIQ